MTIEGYVKTPKPKKWSPKMIAIAISIKRLDDFHGCTATVNAIIRISSK